MPHSSPLSLTPPSDSAQPAQWLPLKNWCVSPEPGAPIAFRLEFVVNRRKLTVAMLVVDMAETLRAGQGFEFVDRSGLTAVGIASSVHPDIGVRRHDILLRGSDRSRDHAVVTVGFHDYARLAAFMERTRVALINAGRWAVSQGHDIARNTATPAPEPALAQFSVSSPRQWCRRTSIVKSPRPPRCPFNPRDQGCLSLKLPLPQRRRRSRPR